MAEEGIEIDLEGATRDFCRARERQSESSDEGLVRVALQRVLERVGADRRFADGDASIGAELARCTSHVPLAMLDEALDRLQIDDLWLAVAARTGDSEAVRIFEVEMLRPTQSSLARIDASSSFRDEVLQRVRVKLLVGTHGECPRLAHYRGRGRLATWTNVVVIREAITMMRKTGRRQQVEADLVLLEATSSGPELAAIKLEHRLALVRALQAAIAGLTPEQRNLLRLHHLHGASIDRLGAMLGLHRSSVARRLEKLRRELLDDTRRRIVEELRIDGTELQLILERIDSQLEISLERMLE